MTKWKRLLLSRKFTLAIAGVVVVIAQDLGLPIDEDTAMKVTGIVIALVLGQGLADSGKVDPEQH